MAIANDYQGPVPWRDMESAMDSKEDEVRLEAYERAKEALEPTLGPAEWVSDGKGAHMEFHPRVDNVGV